MAKVPQRRRVYFGCEGRSERSYIQWLLKVLQKRGFHFYFDTEIAGGGDPLAIVQASVNAKRRKERSGGKFEAAAILLDSDKLGISKVRDTEAVRLASANECKLFWQEFDHESFLLRHTVGNERTWPGRGKTHDALCKVWPTYENPADASWLLERVDYSDWIRALQEHKEQQSFFHDLGLLP